MNRNIQYFTAAIGFTLTLLLLVTGAIPDWVGFGYMAIIAAPLMVD